MHGLPLSVDVPANVQHHLHVTQQQPHTVFNAAQATESLHENETQNAVPLAKRCTSALVFPDSGCFLGCMACSEVHEAAVGTSYDTLH